MWLSYAFGITVFAYVYARNSKDRWYHISIKSCKPEFDNTQFMVVDYKIGFFNESDVSNHRKQ